MGKGEGWGEGSGNGSGQGGNDWDHGLLGCCKSPLHCKYKILFLYSGMGKIQYLAEC